MKYMAQPGAPPAAWQGPLFKEHQEKTNSKTASNTEIQTLPAAAVTGLPKLSGGNQPDVDLGCCATSEIGTWPKAAGHNQRTAQ